MSNTLPVLQLPEALELSAEGAQRALAALPEEQRAQALAFARALDPADPSEVAVYGAAEQGSMQTWLDVAIGAVSQRDLHKSEDSLDQLHDQLRAWERLCAPRRFFIFGGASFPRLRSAYQQAEPAIEGAAGALLDQSIALRHLSKVLERMMRENEAHLQRLGAYQLCGQLRMEQFRAEPASAANPQALIRLERRLQDLQITRQVTLQTRAQLLLLLDGNAQIIDTLERTLKHTLPLWKAQVLVALGLSAQADARKEALRAERALQENTRVTGKAALRRCNQTLLDAVSGLRISMREQQAQEDQIKSRLVS